MGSWISVGLGAAAALCPLPQHGGTLVVMDHTPTTDRLVVCAPDVWIDMGHGHSELPPETPCPTPTPTPPLPSTPRPPAPSPPAPPPAPRPSETPASASAPEPSVTPSAATPRAVSRTTAPKSAEPPGESAPPAAPAPDAVPASNPPPIPTSAPVPPKVRQAFRWVPRPYYTGGPTRPAPAGMSTTMTTVVVTLPGVLAAVALRPGSRRRRRG
ncbi:MULTISPECIES: hypothetical protein [unclassified Streptomyces]|uniref:hypothetical protein n=1 Tax=unclassified Streptomyces TaxID=2593676 RepID=UPI0033A83429